MVLQAGGMAGTMQSRVAPLLLCVAISVALRGVQSTTLMPNASLKTMTCFSCIDQGDNGCATEKAEQVPCQEEHDVCLEAVVGILSSHEHFTVLIKGCGLGGSGQLDKAVPFHGLTIYIQVRQCNESLCNTHLNLEKYQLIQPDYSSAAPNGLGCYGCIGETAKPSCLPSTAPEIHCFNDYMSCFDGNTTVTVGNATVALPIKSCSKRPVCAKKTLKLGGAMVTIMGACCEGNLCNQDLSNKTQLESFPLPEVFADVVENTTSGENSTSYNVTQVKATPSATPDGRTPINMTNPEDGKPTSQTRFYDGKSNDGIKADTPASHASRAIGSVWAVLLLAAFNL